MGNNSLWSNVFIWDRGNFSLKYFNMKETSGLKPISGIWKHTQLCNKGVFFFIVFLQLRWPIELKLSQICYLMHIIQIHQVRTLVFGDYKMCPVALKQLLDNSLASFQYHHAPLLECQGQSTTCRYKNLVVDQHYLYEARL